MSNEVFDFRTPSRVPDDIGQMLSGWQGSTRELLELRWGRCIPNGVKVEAMAPIPVTGAALKDLGHSSITFRVDINESNYPTLILISRPLALALVGEMLGETKEELPEDRSLTDIELTCLDYLIEEMRMSLQTSQKLTPPRKLEMGGQANLKELFGEFPENGTNSEVGFKIELGFGSEVVRWILPQDVTFELAAAFAAGKTAMGENRRAIEQLLLNAPAELRIRLGEAKVSLARLAGLKPGDIVILNQAIDEPLAAEIGGKQLFTGWGGRIGNQQAYQIGEVLNCAVEQQASA